VRREWRRCCSLASPGTADDAIARAADTLRPICQQRRRLNEHSPTRGNSTATAYVSQDDMSYRGAAIVARSVIGHLQGLARL
jgi:hypothetical protein